MKIEEQTIRSRAKIELSTNYESYLPSYVKSQTIYNYEKGDITLDRTRIWKRSQQKWDWRSNFLPQTKIEEQIICSRATSEFSTNYESYLPNYVKYQIMIRTVPIRSYPLKLLPRPPRKQPATTHSREILVWNRPTRQNHQTHMSVGSLIQKLLKLSIIDTTILPSLINIWLPQKKMSILLRNTSLSSPLVSSLHRH